ncbi:reverse transcriptase domain-containing protein [Tanacetum coccineum]
MHWQIMPYTMYKKLGLEEPKATRMSLELADSSDGNNESDPENSIRRLDSANTSYPVTQGTTKRDDVKSEHLYSASANKINEKKPELKNLPQPLEYAYLHGDKSFPIIISSKLSEKEKISLLHALEKQKGAIAWKMSDIKGIRFFQILIALEDQEKTTFTCPYGTFAYKRMPFRLCNAPATFQRCMTAIFHDMVEDFMEVFMDDFSVFGNSFDCCLANLDRILARYDETNLHYTTTENELLAVVFSFDKFRQYLILSKTVVYTDYVALKYLFSKEDAKPRLVRWVLLLQGFDIEIKDKKGAENLTADHLSRLENPDVRTFTEEEITDEFPDEHLMILKVELNNNEPWYAAYVNYIVGKILCPDNVMRRCVAGSEILEILEHCHSEPTEGHYRTLKSKWYDPNVVKTMHPYGTVEIIDKNGINFKVNRQRLKKYHDGLINEEEKEVVELDDDTT